MMLDTKHVPASVMVAYQNVTSSFTSRLTWCANRAQEARESKLGGQQDIAGGRRPAGTTSDEQGDCMLVRECLFHERSSQTLATQL